MGHNMGGRRGAAIGLMPMHKLIFLFYKHDSCKHLSLIHFLHTGFWLHLR